jgi:hypothetical protein
LASSCWRHRLAPRDRRRRSPSKSLVKLERQSWEAWQKRDGGFFPTSSEDHVEVGFGGLTNKAGVVADVQ